LYHPLAKDTLGELQETVDDSVSIGVPHIWIINPWKRTAYTAAARGLERIADPTFRAKASGSELTVPLD
jgi:hypothetical protein